MQPFGSMRFTKHRNQTDTFHEQKQVGVNSGIE